MQIPGIATDKSLVRTSTLTAPQTSQRDRIALTAVPALAATIVGLLMILVSPDLLIVASIVIVLFSGTALLRERQAPANTIILVGQSSLSAMVASSLQQLDSRGLTILRARHLGEAATLAQTHRCDEVVLVGPSKPGAVSVIDARGVHPLIVSGAEKLEQLLNRIPLELAEEDRSLGRMQGVRPLGPTYSFSKRSIDVAIALGLGLALLPLLPLIALAIKLDSRGPILYSQQRVGLNGRTFRIYKFRTMRQDAEKNGAVWAKKQDERVTRTGLFMRKTRMDELPQIWNLLRGDMALVGPRPERPEFTTRLAAEIPAYDLRHAVKPGLTGWAQVCYRYTSSFRDTRAKVEYDLYYVKHCSLLFDIRIMFRTIRVVLAMKGQ
jgi:exopolysaccharide biosynthesis polyprenyl glycosylphosphotransferase